MYNLILTLVIILSVLIVITVMMQPSKQNSAASAFTGGADKLFGKQKRAVLKLLCNAQQQFLAQLDDFIICFGVLIFKIST